MDCESLNDNKTSIRVNSVKRKLFDKKPFSSNDEEDITAKMKQISDNRKQSHNKREDLHSSTKPHYRTVYECNSCHFIANSRLIINSHSRLRHDSQSDCSTFSQCRIDNCNILCDSEISVKDHIENSHCISAKDGLLCERVSDNYFRAIKPSPKKKIFNEKKKVVFKGTIEQSKDDDDLIKGYCSEVDEILSNVEKNSDKENGSSSSPDYIPRLMIDLSPEKDQ